MGEIERTNIAPGPIVATYSHPDWGRQFEQETAKKFLEVGVEYEVERIDVYPSHTDVFLKGFNEKFNSVLFNFSILGNPYDPTGDERNYTWQSKLWRY